MWMDGPCWLGSAVWWTMTFVGAFQTQEAEVQQQSSKYVKQIDELTTKLSDASSLITQLRQQQVHNTASCYSCQ